MPLRYTRPDEGLYRELREVARDALALEESLTIGLNYELPSDFPRDQLLDIVRSLAQLPGGTAEGCHPALLYARNRLPAIRREHLIIEDPFQVTDDDDDAVPPLVRGDFLDGQLRLLIASVTTALDEYRRLAGEDIEDELPDPGIVASDDLVDRVVGESEAIEVSLAEAVETISTSTKQDSERADTLKRQISDGRGLNRLARAELRMPKTVVSWYRWIVDALKDYPTLIRRTADEMKAGSDIAEVAYDRWNDFHHGFATFLFGEFRKSCDALMAIADRLEERRVVRIGIARANGDEFNIEVARAMVLVGRVPPPYWIPSITELEFGTRRLRNLGALPSLTNLRRLTHVSARVQDIRLLSGVTSLEVLDLGGTNVRDLNPLSGLINLRYLNIHWTRVTDIAPLADLINLETLRMSSNDISDISPLSRLKKLRYLYAQHTDVLDLSPLAALINLKHLDIRSSRVTNIDPVLHIKGLFIPGFKPGEA